MSASGIELLAPAGKALTFYARDLAQEPGYRGLWLPEAAGRDSQPPAELPAGGTVSPMGFWFHAAPAPSAGEARVVRVHDAPAAPVPVPRRSSGRPARLTRTVTLPVPELDDEEITLVVGPEVAEVFASPAAWEAMSEAVLLAVAQFWRFYRMEEEFDRLGGLARRARVHAIMPTLASWRQERRLEALDREVRDLAEDWVHYSGMIADPGRYCGSESVAEVYSELAEKLGLEGWAERLDDRVEVVELTWETITEKLLHYKIYIWGLVLEIVIILLIAGTYFWY